MLLDPQLHNKSNTIISYPENAISFVPATTQSTSKDKGQRQKSITEQIATLWLFPYSGPFMPTTPIPRFFGGGWGGGGVRVL